MLCDLGRNTLILGGGHEFESPHRILDAIYTLIC